MIYIKSWNEVFNLVMEIKEEYIFKNGYIKTYNFKEWINDLESSKFSEYYKTLTSIFDCLKIGQHKEYILIRYGLDSMKEDMWNEINSIYRECRYIVINLKDEEIVLTPFRKFFNLNEVEENTYENVVNKIKNAKSVEITNKLDGSMQSARWYKGRVFMSGSSAISKETSWRLREGENMLSESHIQMLKENPNLTFIFEYISLKDAHVVLYNKSDEGLYIIGIRDVTDGRELSYKEIKEFANKYNVKMAEIENVQLDEILEKSKIIKSHEKEGWVLNIDGHKIKIKCDDYVKLHRILDNLSSINVVIENIADNKYDDMISKIPKVYRKRVEAIANKIFEYKNNTEKSIKEYFYQISSKANNKKEFMIMVTNEVPREIQGYVRNMYLGKETNVLKFANRYKKIAEMGIVGDYSAIFGNEE